MQGIQIIKGFRGCSRARQRRSFIWAILYQQCTLFTLLVSLSLPFLLFHCQHITCTYFQIYIILIKTYIYHLNYIIYHLNLEHILFILLLVGFAVFAVNGVRVVAIPNSLLLFHTNWMWVINFLDLKAFFWTFCILILKYNKLQEQKRP